MNKIQKKEQMYLKFGTFSLIGFFIFVFLLLIIGSGSFNKNSVFVETYFAESVQGLAVGSPVKYLGVPIGEVKDINTVNAEYEHSFDADHNFSKYVYVKFTVNSKVFTRKTSYDDFSERINQLVQDGLRVRLTPQGITGNTYLELIFIDKNKKQSTDINVSWIPKYAYLPADTSTMGYFIDSARKLVNNLSKIDLQDLVKKINYLASSVDNTVFYYNREMPNSIENLHQILNSLKDFSSKLNSYPSYVIFGKPPKKLDPRRL